MFCSEPLCSSSFDTVEQFEKHVAENNHSFTKIVTVMDKVEHTFITK